MTKELTRKEQFYKTAKGRYKILGSFKNEYGEEYVLYLYPLMPEVPETLLNVFITGDELDWEEGWQWDENCEQVVRVFLVNNEERQSIKNLLASI